MNTGDVIQIEALDFDPDIDERLPTQEHQEAQYYTTVYQKISQTQSPCFIAMRCRRSRLAGCDTC